MWIHKVILFVTAALAIAHAKEDLYSFGHGRQLKRSSTTYSAPKPTYYVKPTYTAPTYYKATTTTTKTTYIPTTYTPPTYYNTAARYTPTYTYVATKTTTTYYPTTY